MFGYCEWTTMPMSCVWSSLESPERLAELARRHTQPERDLWADRGRSASSSAVRGAGAPRPGSAATAPALCGTSRPEPTGAGKPEVRRSVNEIVHLLDGGAGPGPA